MIYHHLIDDLMVSRHIAALRERDVLLMPIEFLLALHHQFRRTIYKNTHKCDSI